MAKYTPEFGKDFSTPAVEGGLRSLFLLARALQPGLAALKVELKTLTRILPRLGECSHHHCGTEGPSKDLDRVWDEFFNNSDISKLPPKALEILQAARATSLKLAGAEPDCIADLSGAHERGYLLVESMLKTNGLSSLVVRHQYRYWFPTIMKRSITAHRPAGSQIESAGCINPCPTPSMVR